MVMRMELDPVVALAGAAQLAATVDELSAAAAKVQPAQATVGPRPPSGVISWALR